MNSDKIISKWETGVSIPDTSLLVPLADLFGVTVTELLMSERMIQEAPLDANQVEAVVQTALSYTEDNTTRAYQTKTKLPVYYDENRCGLFMGAWDLTLERCQNGHQSYDFYCCYCNKKSLLY